MTCKAFRKLDATGRGDLVAWQSEAEAREAMADFLAETFFALKPPPPRPHRTCFAVVGPSAVGKTRLAIPLRHQLAHRHAPTTLVRRDSFIRGKDTGRRWFDEAAAETLRRQVMQWLKSESSDDQTVRLANVPKAHCPKLPQNGIVLFDDLRRMPELPIAGGICLIGEPVRLTQQEAARNQVSWPWWERLRRSFVKHRYQTQLLKRVRRGDLPWMVVHREPDTGGFTGWKAQPFGL